MDRPREPLPSRVEGLPELPPEAIAILADGLSRLGLGEAGDDVRAAIVDHLRLLLVWNRSINLTAIRDPVEAVRRHILDSLTAISLLRRHGSDAFVDIGSGGGYPGLPLAAALPARRALLVDSVAKKARFLQAAAAATGLDGTVEAFAGRAEALAADRRHRDRWPAALARAVGSLVELAELGLPLVEPDGLLIAWKRADIGPELERARPAIEAMGGGIPLVVPAPGGLGLDGHVLVVVTKVRPTPSGYPRDPAVRRRDPLWTRGRAG